MNQKFFKYFLISIAGLMVFVTVGFFVLVAGLPSKKEISKILNQPLTAIQNKPTPTTTLQEITDIPDAETMASDEETEDAYIPSMQPPAPPSSLTLEKIKLFIAEDPKDIRVCENLGKTTEAPKKDIEIGSILDTETRTNPFYEAIRFPIRAIFQDSNISELISEIEPLSGEEISPEEKESFLTKVGFYAKAAKAAAGLYKQKSYFEQMGDRANHLTALAKLAALKPELSSDSRVLEYCLEVENALKFGEEISVKDERKALLGLLDSLNVKPSDINFDPTIYNKFQIKLDKSQFRVDLKNQVIE